MGGMVITVEHKLLVQVDVRGPQPCGTNSPRRNKEDQPFRNSASGLQSPSFIFNVSRIKRFIEGKVFKKDQEFFSCLVPINGV